MKRLYSKILVFILSFIAGSKNVDAQNIIGGMPPLDDTGYRGGAEALHFSNWLRLIMAIPLLLIIAGFIKFSLLRFIRKKPIKAKRLILPTTLGIITALLFYVSAEVYKEYMFGINNFYNNNDFLKPLISKPLIILIPLCLILLIGTIISIVLGIKSNKQ